MKHRLLCTAVAVASVVGCQPASREAVEPSAAAPSLTSPADTAETRTIKLNVPNMT